MRRCKSANFACTSSATSCRAVSPVLCRSAARGACGCCRWSATRGATHGCCRCCRTSRTPSRTCSATPTSSPRFGLGRGRVKLGWEESFDNTLSLRLVDPAPNCSSFWWCEATPLGTVCVAMHGWFIAAEPHVRHACKVGFSVMGFTMHGRRRCLRLTDISLVGYQAESLPRGSKLLTKATCSGLALRSLCADSMFHCAGDGVAGHERGVQHR